MINRLDPGFLSHSENNWRLETGMFKTLPLTCPAVDSVQWTTKQSYLWPYKVLCQLHMASWQKTVSAAFCTLIQKRRWLSELVEVGSISNWYHASNFKFQMFHSDKCPMFQRKMLCVRKVRIELESQIKILVTSMVIWLEFMASKGLQDTGPYLKGRFITRETFTIAHKSCVT